MTAEVDIDAFIQQQKLKLARERENIAPDSAGIGVSFKLMCLWSAFSACMYFSFTYCDLIEKAVGCP